LRRHCHQKLTRAFGERVNPQRDVVLRRHCHCHAGCERSAVFDPQRDVVLRRHCHPTVAVTVPAVDPQRKVMLRRRRHAINVIETVCPPCHKER
ncbi:MAG: hypothetical protein OXB90_01000, partial [Acidimicrobiaceae bacterium]|nr:hypothetical protein [Acidimicrobiaceae bacterium]